MLRKLNFRTKIFLENHAMPKIIKGSPLGFPKIQFHVKCFGDNENRKKNDNLEQSDRVENVKGNPLDFLTSIMLQKNN